MTTRKQVDLLISQLEKVISHAENDTLDYSVLEEARKLVFEIEFDLFTNPEKNDELD